MTISADSAADYSFLKRMHWWQKIWCQNVLGHWEKCDKEASLHLKNTFVEKVKKGKDGYVTVKGLNSSYILFYN